MVRITISIGGFRNTIPIKPPPQPAADAITRQLTQHSLNRCPVFRTAMARAGTIHSLIIKEDNP